MEERRVKDGFIASLYIAPLPPTKVQQHHEQKGSQTRTLYSTMQKKDHHWKTSAAPTEEWIFTSGTPHRR
jgi:hypothetical protein